ncbi:hypothetical protein SDRG_11839 [Saprolegnia diclina VS20]|uniref:Uncharacterized protein n=1 Tax=Saprolegnia diclina (strain VS20) TaxID=1156394 RepID=T0RKV4_SAPDV|nr:hypothetical protein SDRG_11839 [Saprolegnia diclina VS20]EQC30522.1 hypothetical protein SDRG_11839 [Saprolegnia diclina VS20]|eukprot:XP_008616115.1 hypothetical protein SDRG_11839 [Saprolegnia diclina VS20]
MHVAQLHTKPLLLLRLTMALAFISCLWRNSVRTGAMREVVAAHRSLLTPAKTAFSIWGLIYLTLFLFVSRECIFPSLSLLPAHAKRVYGLFIASCVFNMLWLEVFASGAIVWSLPVILVLWAITGALYLTTASLVQLPTLFDGLAIWPRRTAYECSSLSDYICLRLPFTLYFSWTCGATLINVTVSLRGLGYDLNLAVYMVCLAVLLAAHVTALAYNGDIAFGAVGIWTLAWLAAKHETGLSPVDADYLDVIQLVAHIGAWLLVALIAGLVLLRCYVRRYGAPEHAHMDASGGKNANISMYGTL